MAYSFAWYHIILAWNLLTIWASVEVYSVLLRLESNHCWIHQNYKQSYPLKQSYSLELSVS